MLLPCEDNCLRSATLDRHACRIGRFDQLPCDIDRALTSVIEAELSFQRNLDSLKRDLSLRCDYSASRAFAAVDKYGDRTIDNTNLRNFLSNHGAYLLENELV